MKKGLELKKEIARLMVEQMEVRRGEEARLAERSPRSKYWDTKKWDPQKKKEFDRLEATISIEFSRAAADPALSFEIAPWMVDVKGNAGIKFLGDQVWEALGGSEKISDSGRGQSGDWPSSGEWSFGVRCTEFESLELIARLHSSFEKEINDGDLIFEKKFWGMRFKAFDYGDAELWLKEEAAKEEAAKEKAAKKQALKKKWSKTKKKRAKEKAVKKENNEEKTNP